MTKENLPSLHHADTLVTGATGFIGRWLLASLTRDGQKVAALVRNADKRRDELASSVNRLGGDARNLLVVEGDVEQEGLGLRAPLTSIRVVHHLAARFAFGLSRPEAHATNVKGTEHVMRWAASLPHLERFVFLGGYRMTAYPLASLDARALDRHYEAGAYEGSKMEAYVVFRRLAAELGVPWTAVHPSGVIGDSRTGETTQREGLGDTVKALFEGRLPALAGSARTFVPIVTIDYLADYLASVPRRLESQGQDLVVLDPASPTLPTLVAMMARVLGVEAPSMTLPVGLVRALPSAWTGLHRESAGFLVEDRYDTRDGDAHAAALGLVHPPCVDALARWSAFLVSTHFLTRASEPSSVRVHYAEGLFVAGDVRRADVLLLHGIPFDGEAMRPLSALLEAQGVSTARVDLPGLGRSGSRPSTGLDIAWLARLLEGRTKPIVLLGHSLGATLAVRFAATFPDAVQALVLVAPTFLNAPPSMALQLRPAVAHVLCGLDAVRFQERFLAGANDEAVRPAIESALLSLKRQGGASRYAALLAEVSTHATRRDTLHAYRALRARGMPITIVHADREPLVEDARGAIVSMIEGAGHNPHLTHPEDVHRAVIGHIPTRRQAALDVRAPL